MISSLAVAQVDVWTHHNDNARTGANLAETKLTTSNVNVNTFGKLFSYSVDADVYAQPLVISNVTIPGKGVHNVVYVATMNNTVYAFDADNNKDANALPLWTRSFNDPGNGITAVPSGDVGSGGNIRVNSTVGVMGTPVIDRATGTMYLVARTKEPGPVYKQKLHALDIATGAEKFGGPVQITATMAGTGYGSSGGVVTFNARTQNQRPGLALANAKVYIAWASHEDRTPYHGWVMAYDAATLQRVGLHNTSPDGSMAGIWQAGQPPAIDAAGNLYFMTGNGTFTANTGGRGYGESIVKLSPNLNTVMDWFTPEDWNTLNYNDADLGSAGVLLLPGTNYVLGGGKSGYIYVLDTINGMGHVHAGNTGAFQVFDASGAGHIHGTPVYWNGPGGPLIYVWPEYDYVRAFRFNGTNFTTPEASKSNFTAPYGMPGAFLSISANASTAGSGILWASLPCCGDAENGITGGVLRAFNASDLSQQLWNSRANIARDDLGNFAKYVPPTVANGRVYLASFSNKLHVYGILGSLPLGSGGALIGSATASTAAVDLTSQGTADWAHWPGYDHKAGGNGQISDFTALGGAAATYTNDPRSMSWSDGTPTVSGSNTSGVHIGGVGYGFQITAPADTNDRTLKIYVGGYNSRGSLTATLSDNSAGQYIDTSLSGGGQYDGVYTLSYRASGPGQQINVIWSQYSGSGNVTLQGAALVGGTSSGLPPAAPTNVSASDGTLTSAVVVSWSPSANATSYTVYRSTQAGVNGPALATTSSTSYSDGTAQPGTIYYYSVSATGAGGQSGYSTQDSGFVQIVSSGGSMTGSVTDASTPSTVNLTAVGTSDYRKWPSGTQKQGGGGQVSTFTVLGGGSSQTYSDDPRTVNWTDGTPQAQGSSTYGSNVFGVGNGFQFTVPADQNLRTLYLYVGGNDGGGQLTAHLSDGSAVDFVDTTFSNRTGKYAANYTISYQAGAAAQQLLVKWVQTSGGGYVSFQAAALAGGGAPPPTPPPVPTGVSASDGTSTTQVSVTWTASSGATSYTVYRSTTAGVQGSAIANPTTNSYADTTAVAGTVYYYSVAATGSGGTSAVSAQDSGFVASASSGGGSMAGSVIDATTPSTVNLTAVGTSDYRKWPSGTQKQGGGGQVSTFTVLGGGSSETYSDDPRTVNWTDGNPQAQGSSTYGSNVFGIGSGFQFSVPADQNLRTVYVYVGGNDGGGRLTAHLSDGSAVDFVDTTFANRTGKYAANYTINYQAGAAGQQLLVKWVQASGGGYLTFQGAALAGSGTSPSPTGGLLTGTPAVSTSSSTVNLTSVGTSDWKKWPSGTHKAGGGSQIGGYTRVGSAPAYNYSDDLVTAQWSDGTPEASGSSRYGVEVYGVGNGFQVSVPAATTLRTLVLYVGGYKSGGTLTTQLSDGSAADYIDASASSSSGRYAAKYTITFRAASAGQRLRVKWVKSSGTGSVRLQAVALQ